MRLKKKKTKTWEDMFTFGSDNNGDSLAFRISKFEFPASTNVGHTQRTSSVWISNGDACFETLPQT